MGENEESLLEYPCDFPLAVIGMNSAEFPGFVMDIVRKHVPHLEEENYTLHPSRNENYISVRVNFIAESREQLDDLYRELTRQDCILWVL